MIELYADGGVIKKNPSEIGGTWAFVVTIEDDLLYRRSGVYTPEKLHVHKVTNNHMELIALLKGLDFCIEKGLEIERVYSDSNVSLGRLFRGWGMKNIPPWLVRKKEEIMSHYNINTMRWQLLDGHPTKKQLEAGIGKRCHPVSKWNVKCDTLCNEEAQHYLETLILV